MTGPGISAGRARQHEALVIKLEALLEDVRKLAAKAPEAAVQGALRAAAEAILYDAQKFRLRGRREKFPVAPATLGALAVELGQARAKLEAFELTHSFWSIPHKAHLWRVAGETLPVRRLRPALAADNPDDAPERPGIRREMMRKLTKRVERAYDKGYEDGATGKPPSPDGPWPPGVSEDFRKIYSRSSGRA